MKKRLYSILLTVVMMVVLIPAFTMSADAATAPTKMWVESSDTNGMN